MNTTLQVVLFWIIVVAVGIWWIGMGNIAFKIFQDELLEKTGKDKPTETELGWYIQIVFCVFGPLSWAVLLIHWSESNWGAT